MWSKTGKEETRLKFADAEIVLHRHRDYAPDVWLCSCFALQIEHEEVARGGLEALPSAKIEAVIRAKERLKFLFAALGKAAKGK